MAAKARELKEQGLDVINLSQGEPDFKTPEYICQAAKDAIKSGLYFSYPPTGGYADLREAIARKYKSDHGVSCGWKNVVVSNGAKQALSNIMLATLDPGDEAIILGPYWVSYWAQVMLTGAKPIIVNGAFANGFKVTIEQLKGALSSRTRALIFSSPSNPTGLVYTRSELQALADLLISFPDIMVVADEIYSQINYGTETASFASLAGMSDRTVTINGFSKCHAMTGWRVGYSIAPERIAKEVIKLQGHVSSANCSIAQRAAVAALSRTDSTEEMVREYRARRDLAFDILRSISGIKLNLPEGAFYFFAKTSDFYGRTFRGQRIGNSEDLCTYLLAEAHVSLVPGNAFGDDSCVRISYAASRSEIERALVRIGEALGNLR